MTILIVPPATSGHRGLDILRDPLPGAETNVAIRAVDWILRGISQVVFQSNWLTGIVILAGITYNSPVYGVAFVSST